MIAEPPIAEDRLWKEAMQFWGVASVPFPEGFGAAPYRSDAVEKTLLLLRQTAALRSVSLIVGEPGVGKSSLVAWWCAQLDPKQYRPLIITHSALSGTGLLAMVVHKLGKVPRMRRDANLQLLEAASAELGRVTPVLILDEAQNYHRSALEEMRLLFGLNLGRQPLFGLVLMGDNYLLDTLRLQSYRALYSRISSFSTLPRLIREEIPIYLSHGLGLIGQKRSIFAPTSIEMLIEASAGVPRTLNFLARHAWAYAASLRASEILPDHVGPALHAVPASEERITF
jgi:type II secretory pathway predicted ATPase ExeA